MPKANSAPQTFKLLSWNVNGIRSCASKTFFNWFASETPDIICLQETKAHPDQLDETLTMPTGYVSHWDSAEKRGYSGVATWTKHQPHKLSRGLGVRKFDAEGRTLITEYEHFVLINAYFPNSQRDHARVDYKIDYCKTMAEFCMDLRRQNKHVIICGDFNIAHRPIDLRNPKQNENNAGYLPVERAWMDKFLDLGFVDIFRRRTADPHHYTWWSYRPGVREKNIGWRIDYFIISPELERFVVNAYHQPQVLGSDHCPIGLELKFP